MSDVRVPRAEQLVIDACAGLAAERMLCTSLGWGQLATTLARQSPSSHVACHFLDLHPYEQALHLAAEADVEVDWQCTADLPAGPFDLAAIPVSRFGEAELTRNILQDAYERLTEGGLLVTAVDNRDDKWLHEELSKLFAKVTREPGKRGVVYRGRRRVPLKRPRDFRSEFAFRDQGKLVKAVSRPGVFSHRQLDLGARALLEVMEVRAGERVLDMGCGSGVVGLAAALRAEHVFVQGIDSNARAVACMREGAALNDLTVTDEALTKGQKLSAVRVALDAEGRVWEPGTYDVVLGNPPYYSHYQIADIFLQAAKRALKKGGRVHIVTKTDHWHLARMPQLFANEESLDVRGYKVVTATAR
ncbi:MAG: methyltransferase [Planctomycetaceae bacterium]|nr:methyltransferase [Planctomycetaceae bacterium]